MSELSESVIRKRKEICQIFHTIAVSNHDLFESLGLPSKFGFDEIMQAFENDYHFPSNLYSIDSELIKMLLDQYQEKESYRSIICKRFNDLLSIYPSLFDGLLAANCSFDKITDAIENNFTLVKNLYRIDPISMKLILKYETLDFEKWPLNDFENALIALTHDPRLVDLENFINCKPNKIAYVNRNIKWYYVGIIDSEGNERNIHRTKDNNEPPFDTLLEAFKLHINGINGLLIQMIKEINGSLNKFKLPLPESIRDIVSNIRHYISTVQFHLRQLEDSADFESLSSIFDNLKISVKQIFEICDKDVVGWNPISCLKTEMGWAKTHMNKNKGNMYWSCAAEQFEILGFNEHVRRLEILRTLIINVQSCPN